MSTPWVLAVMRDTEWAWRCLTEHEPIFSRSGRADITADMEDLATHGLRQFPIHFFEHALSLRESRLNDERGETRALRRVEGIKLERVVSEIAER